MQTPERQDGWAVRFRRWSKRHEIALTLALVIFILLVAYLAPRIFISVHAGRRGVLWSRFGGGTVTDTVYGEGMHIIFPWNVMAIYDTRVLQVRDRYDVLSKDGLPMQATISIRYELIGKDLGFLHEYIGPNYVATLVVPEVGAHARRVIAQYAPEEIYSTRRREIETRILSDTTAAVRSSLLIGGVRRQYLHVEDILIRSVTLPPTIRAAIESKLTEQQTMFEYDYRLVRERKEAQRKEIEAQGIRRFQDVVSDGISDRYLRWKGIDATMELARSNNSKVVIIGGSGDGLPLILGGLEAPAPRPAPATPPRKP